MTRRLAMGGMSSCCPADRHTGLRLRVNLAEKLRVNLAEKREEGSVYADTHAELRCPCGPCSPRARCLGLWKQRHLAWRYWRKGDPELGPAGTQPRNRHAQ